MAGIGVKLNRIFDRGTITASAYGAVYSTGITIAPFLAIIAIVQIMQFVLGVSKDAYSAQSLLSCTLLYIFIMGELSVAPCNTVLSKYVEDKIYNERYDDVMPAVYVGMLQVLVLSNLMGIPLYLHLFFKGGIPLYYVFTSYLGLLTFTVALYFMIYLSISKDYAKISLYFILGMALTAGLSLILCLSFGVAATYALLVGLVVGFFLIAILEFSRIKAFFQHNTSCFGDIWPYYKRYWKLSLANLLYMTGLFAHNFVFWQSDMRTIVASTYLVANPYDVASTLGMFTNITASVIFIVLVERSFNMRYKEYSEAVIGGRMRDIVRAKNRLIRNCAQILTRLVQYQFALSTFVFLLFCALLPKFGFSGMVLKIYPSLTAGYFVLFIYFALLSFLYYFMDENGALLSASVFLGITIVVSILASLFAQVQWYGIGLFIGAIVGLIIGFFRLRWCERNFETQTFSEGNIIRPRAARRVNEPVYTQDRRRKTKRVKKDE